MGNRARSTLVVGDESAPPVSLLAPPSRRFQRPHYLDITGGGAARSELPEKVRGHTQSVMKIGAAAAAAAAGGAEMQ